MDFSSIIKSISYFIYQIMIQQKHFTSNVRSKPLTNSVKFDKFNVQQKNLNRDLSKSSLTHVVSETHFKRSGNSPIKKIVVNGLYSNKNTSFASVQNDYLMKEHNNHHQRSSKDFILQELNDSYSIGGHSKNTLQTNQYYKYWKSKAHQYLDQNFKLREENKKIKLENQQLRNRKNKSAIQLKEKQSDINLIPEIQIVKKQTSFQHLQNLFKDKMNQLQKDVASKNIIIAQLQNKVIQLNKKILGEQQREKLQNRLGEQIQTLSIQNIRLKGKISTLQGIKQVIKNNQNPKRDLTKPQNTYKDVRKKYSDQFKLN